MACAEKQERRQRVESGSADHPISSWGGLSGNLLPGSCDHAVVALGDPDHPARLRLGDLENPDAFHSRLKAWLLQQG